MRKEIWKPVNVLGYSEFYLVSNFGSLKKRRRLSKWNPNKIIPEKRIAIQVCKKGYQRNVLKGHGNSKWFYIHRLVALTFLEPIEGKPHVNHKDGNKLNNYYKNLEWCTPQENNEHGFRTGLLKRNTCN